VPVARRSAILAGTILVFALAARPVAAHQTSVKYVTVVVTGARLDVTVKVAPTDVTEPLHLPNDARPTATDAAGAPEVAPYVARWLAIAADDQPCTAGPPTARPDADARFVVVAFSATCAVPPTTLTLDFAAFFAVDTRHVAIVHLSSPGSEPADAIVRASDTPLVLRLDHPTTGFAAWIGAGIAHIWQGVDHIAFLLALLLVVMLARARAPIDWELRTPLSALRRTAGVVTAFTVGHSISLALASLGIVTLPGRFVECAIAASIVYTAAEDIVRPAPRGRFVIAFAFGLVHGLGFASVLAELLPPSHIAIPLVGFNAGVEVGQLAIVALALPVLFGTAWLVGPRRYRRVVLPVVASAILALGLVFFIERVGGWRITGM